MFGCEALNASTTFFSTTVCSGASPPPMQQNQRISTGPPGGTVAGPLEGSVVGPADELGATATGDELAGVDGPQAAKTRAMAAMSEPTLKSLVRMVLLSMIRPGRSSRTSALVLIKLLLSVWPSPQGPLPAVPGPPRRAGTMAR